MFPTGSFDRMLSDLYDREREKGTDIPITVGILIADFRRQFCKENIFNQLECLDKKSGPLIDFYIPGYCMTKEIDEHYASDYTFKNKKYSFSPKYFDGFVEELEDRNIKVTGRTQMLLLTYESNHLVFDDVMSFDLEKDDSAGKIESVKLFFDFIFDISKQTVLFEEFKRKLTLKRVKNSFLSFSFLKEHLPGALFSLLIPSTK